MFSNRNPNYSYSFELLPFTRNITRAKKNWKSTILFSQSIEPLDPFGSSTKQMIYWKMLLESRNGSSSESAILDPQALEHSIRESCGATAPTIERSIASEIMKTFRLSDEETRSIASAIEAAKAQLAF